MDIYLIRHTEVAVGRSVAYGQTDVDLTDTYPEQRDRLQMHLPDEVSAIFSSPLTRCRRLANDLAAGLSGGSQVETAPGQTALVDTHRPAVRFDDRLKEYAFGDWEMTPWADIDRAALDHWMADFVNVATPNGENFSQVFDRVGAFWREQVLPLCHASDSHPVLVVAHGGVIRALLCLFLDLSLQNAYRLSLDYGAVTKLTVSGSIQTGTTYTIQYINR
ncbi:MAG: histidine phosphatase family protein [Spirosoma sp.]|nr:histidine phosphatase family protein [Spirosoma sp.]